MFAAQPIPSSLMNNAFLLNPKNAGFLDGSERKFYDFRTSNTIGLAIIFVMFGIFGGAMVYGGGREVVTRSELEQAGIETSATVTDLRHTTSTDSKGRTTNHYYVTYEFFVGQGNSDNPASYIHEQEISHDTYSSLSEQDSLPIRYLPSDPTVSRLLSDTEDNGIILLIVGLFFASFVVVIGYFALRQWGRNKRLIEEGQIIAGKIETVSGSRVKGGYSVSIRYCFRSPEGVELSRKESAIRNDLRSIGLPKADTPVAIVYVNEKLYRML